MYIRDEVNSVVLESRFPDGQPHVKLGGGSPNYCPTIVTAIKNGDDLLKVLLVRETLLARHALSVNLDITYMLAARMDRRIDSGQPFTLKVVAGLLAGKFEQIRVLDPHSDVTCALLDATPISALPYVRNAIYGFSGPVNGGFALCAPDAGAAKRVEAMGQELGISTVQCFKHRDMQTGLLSKFRLLEDDVPENILIVDDICDGGRTFTGVSNALRAAGAKRVGLYVTHGIFSNGFDIPGIDSIYTTDSYLDEALIATHGAKHIAVYQVSRGF